MNVTAASVDAPASSDLGRSQRRDLLVAALVGLVVFVVFNANMRSIAAGDAYPARYLPFGILRDGSLALDRLQPNVSQGRGRGAYWAIKGRGGRTISLYPVVLPLVVTPLYVPAVVHLNLRGWSMQRLERVARIMEKVAASLLASAATAVMYLLLRRRAGRALAGALALVFALGTTTWVVSSQALWQHGLGQLLGAGALLLVTGPCDAKRALAFGTLCGLLASNRPPDSILAAALVVAGLWWCGRRFASRVLVGAAVPAGLTLAYNLVVAGNVAGGYGLIGRPSFLQHDLAAGLAGLLVSPTKGLFVFSPFLLLVPLSYGALLRDAGSRRLTLAITVGLALQLMLYARADWRAGASWGPRWLTDTLPFLFWMLPPLVARLRSVGRALFALACGTAIVIEAIGAFWYAGTSDAAILGGGTSSNPMRGAWTVRNAPFLAELQHDRAPADLLVDVQGFFDGIEQGGALVSTVSTDEAADAVGWTLVGKRTPLEVRVFVDDRLVGVTRAFFPRPDVESYTHERSAAGWRVPLPTGNVAPGKHLITIQARAAESSDPRYVGERRVLFARTRARAGTPGPGDGAEEATLRAASTVREHQDAAGFWLTSFTGSPSFVRPSREMNTFLTSVLVDLLGPVAGPAGLEPSLERARRHLRAQIEPGGLVRYHGLPDAPTIGTLGCAITPDADDTALVWRLTPGPPGALPGVLATLGRYRTPEGLYRTWLAPRERFQCIDPGRDPNPPDVAIQMHLLLFLARAQPAAARDLCAALGRRIGDEDLWVYYRKAPLIPILRQAELARSGCALPLPEARIRTAVPGQDLWVTACTLLGRYLGTGPRPHRNETLAVLDALAEDGFATLRRAPPLLYHNDLTASVSRYYWSEDFGYAVWLRLRFEAER